MNGSHNFEIATLVLSCVSVLVTTIGIVIAILAFFGYSTLKKTLTESTKRAADEAVEVARKRLQEELPAIKKEIIESITNSHENSQSVLKNMSKSLNISKSDTIIDNLEDDNE